MLMLVVLGLIAACVWRFSRPGRGRDYRPGDIRTFLNIPAEEVGNWFVIAPGPHVRRARAREALASDEFLERFSPVTRLNLPRPWWPVRPAAPAIAIEVRFRPRAEPAGYRDPAPTGVSIEDVRALVGCLAWLPPAFRAREDGRRALFVALHGLAARDDLPFTLQVLPATDRHA